MNEARKTIQVEDCSCQIYGAMYHGVPDSIISQIAIETSYTDTLKFRIQGVFGNGCTLDKKTLDNFLRRITDRFVQEASKRQKEYRDGKKQETAMKDAEHADTKSKLEDAKEDLRDLEIASLKQQIEHLKQLLMAKDQEISTWRGSCESQHRSIDDLRLQIADGSPSEGGPSGSGKEKRKKSKTNRW